MVEESEIYRSAMQLIEEEGPEALLAARLMAEEMRGQGNDGAARVWGRIHAAVKAVLDRDGRIN